jgi:hypothetical protein
MLRKAWKGSKVEKGFFLIFLSYVLKVRIKMTLGLAEPQKKVRIKTLFAKKNRPLTGLSKALLLYS